MLFHAINDYILFHQADVHNLCSFLLIVEFLGYFHAVVLLDNILVNMSVHMAFFSYYIIQQIPKSRIIVLEIMNLFMAFTHIMNLIFLGELKERMV